MEPAVLHVVSHSEEALELLAPKSKIRVLEYPESWLTSKTGLFDARRVMGGWLLQDWDRVLFY